MLAWRPVKDATFEEPPRRERRRRRKKKKKPLRKSLARSHVDVELLKFTARIAGGPVELYQDVRAMIIYTLIG